MQQALTEEREAQKDHVESKLLERIDKGSDTAIIFYLKTQARDRGYNERQQPAPAGTIIVHIDPSGRDPDEVR